jgi:uncharacterized repeat protein (TIGR03943 family)
LSGGEGAARPPDSTAALLALGYGIYLLQAYARGTLLFYIHPIYVMPAAATGALLVLLGALAWRGDLRVTARAALLLAVPLVLGLVLPPRPLGIAAAAQRGLDAGGGPGPAATAAALEDLAEFQLHADPATFTIKDWVKAFAADPDPAAHAGKPVRVTGFVYRDTSLPPGHVFVARFVVQCCAVDARPVGLPVRAVAADALAAGAWVAVQGEIDVADLGGRRRPVVVATSVEAAERPAQPYLY